MNRRKLQASTVTHAVAVVGSDLDQSLVAKLTAGDKLLVEANGVRAMGETKCPLVAVKPWEVILNDPSPLQQSPSPCHKLVLKHPNSSIQLVLPYGSLLNVKQGRPAVFHLVAQINAAEHPKAMYVILQLVSHYMPATDVDFTFEPHDPESARLVLEAEGLRPSIVGEWVEAIKTFKKDGWTQKAAYRLALRANVPPNVIEAFRMEDWEFLGRLDVETLLKIQKALHWLPAYIEQSPLAVSRETRDYPSGDQPLNASQA